MTGPERVFPLIPARRGSALDVAGRQSRRRGSGGEVASSRPYRRGDAVRNVDWAASARLSSARGTDEFVVRETFAEDAVRVVLVVDRSPSMALFPDWLPWLDKPAAVREAGAMIVASAAATGALIGLVAVGNDGNRSLPVRRGRDQARAILQLLAATEPDGPPQSLDRALESLSRRVGGIAHGTFVFVLSDFLPAPSLALLRGVAAAGFDVVPVVIQDPVWEQSFPDVPAVTLPLVDPASGDHALVRLSRKEVRGRREANELRATRLHQGLLELELDPVAITGAGRESVHASFLHWAHRRRLRAQGAR